MPRPKIIIDCDPGVDDAINLVLAMAARDAFDVIAVTAVGGNVSSAQTARNARAVLNFTGGDDILVYEGCPQPMVRELETAPHIHGAEGLGWFDPTPHASALAPGHGTEAILNLLETANGGVTLVATGPLTNVATALAMRPVAAEAINRIVLMGGAYAEGGNVTASAEYNIWSDPHAAAAIFHCGRPITAIGLDATHKALATPERLEAFRRLPGPVGEALCGWFDFSNDTYERNFRTTGAPLHDPCTIAWLLAPELFAAKPARIEVETGSPLTLGHTAVDTWSREGQAANADWVHDVDADGLYAMIAERAAPLCKARS